MTDPLRPFADAIRGLWRTRVGSALKSESGAGASSAPTAASEAARTAGSRTGESLRSRLAARITGIATANPDRLREAFVETVLLWELGEQLAPDPAFAQLVTRVAEQLVADPRTGERLNRLLLDMHAARAGR